MTPPAPQTIVALDLETTGLHPFFAEICEIGAVAFDANSGAPLGSWHSLVHPGRPIPEVVTAIHGITDDMVVGAPSLPEVFPSLLRFIGAETAVTGHNVAFDLGFLRHRAAKFNQPLPCVSCIDTVRLSKWAFPGLASYRLGKVAEALGVEHLRAHRALEDAQATREVYLRALKQLALNGHPQSAVYGRALKSLEDLGRITEAKLPPGMAELWRQTEARMQLRITYSNAQKEITTRVIDPLGMQMVSSQHYLIAWCHLKEANRNFRVDRIVEWEIVGPIATPVVVDPEALIYDPDLGDPLPPEADADITADPPVETFA